MLGESFSFDIFVSYAHKRNAFWCCGLSTTDTGNQLANKTI